jgi:signal transduction histidine kinase
MHGKSTMESRRPSLAAVAVALGLLVVSAVAAYAVTRAVDRREEQALENRATEVAGIVDRRTDAYVEKLYGLRGLFAARDGIPSARQYDEFLASQQVEERLPTLRTLTWVDYFTDDERPAVLRRLRRDTAAMDYPPIRILPRGRRSVYAVIAYGYPFDRANRSVVGTDLLTDTAREAAIERARNTAQASAPLPVRLVQDPLTLAVVIYFPVYDGANQMPPEAERSQRFVGVVAAGVRLRDLLSGIPDAEDITLKLYDDGLVGTIRTPRLLYAERNAAEDAPSETLPLLVAGRRWRLEYATDAPLAGGLERAVPFFILGFGVVISILAGAFVHTATLGRRRALAALAFSRDELARSNEELERFAFLASHDLQQPLRTVSGFLQLLERQQAGKLDERGREYIAHALRGTKQMSSLIADLLAYSRVGRDDRPLEVVPLDDAWDSAVEQLQATIEGAGAAVSRGPLPQVVGDRGQLTQVFANLIGNGVKYRGEAPPVVRADAARVNGAWEVAVQDNGMGIDPRDHHRIFEMFRRLHSDDDIEGTGVGLALAKKIVERSGGDIRVESERGAGSRFVLRLRPADPVEQERA